MLRRRRRSVLLVVVVLTLTVLTVRLLQDSSSEQADASPTPSATSSSSATMPTDEALLSETPSPTPSVTEEGEGTYRYADVPDGATTAGDDGDLLTYHVAVEEGIGENAAEFAEFVDRVLRDERGWSAEGDWRFEHSEDDGVDFTIYLVSPTTRAQLCESEDTFTSCRNGDAVVVNLARWLDGVEHWDATLEEYRAYIINHEVGHRLGEGHVVCPKANTPSPVMAQQTLGLHGCEPNPWPYVNGEYLTGPPGEYE